MKKIPLVTTAIFMSVNVWAQSNVSNYPDPEFSNEVYLYRKDSDNKLTRLEKNVSKMETKTKAGGMGGAENGYSLDGEKSTVRIVSNNISFVFSTGSTQSGSPKRDSVMRANGMDPSMMSGSMMDPTSMITLYKAEPSKGKRKITLMKMPGAMSFGSKKMTSSDKYSFSVRKIREGYWELMLDKPLPKGEYAFSTMYAGAGSMDASSTFFAFGVE